MKIFWYEFKKSVKEEKSFSVSNIWSFNTSVLWCWKLRISLDDLFRLKKYNSDIKWCIDIIAKKVAINWLYLEDNKWEVLDKQKFKKQYDYLETLFKTQTFNFWKNKFFTQTLIAWENYIEPQKNTTWKIVKFATIDARSMHKIIDPKTWNITGFKQYVNVWTPKEFWFNDLWYFIAEEDTENEYLSMWKLDWIIYDVLWDLEATKTNYYFFQNDAIPSAVFMLDKNMTKTQLDVAREQIRQKFAWAENKHKFLVSNWVEDVKTLVMSHTDMDFLNQRKFTIDKVSATFWVPKELLWYVADVWSYWRIKEINREFKNSTIEDHETYLENMMNMLITNFRSELLVDLTPYIIRCDSESFEDRDTIEANQRKDISTWILTINEVRAERWLVDFKEDFTNKPLIPTNLQLEPKTNTI